MGLWCCHRIGAKKNKVNEKFQTMSYHHSGNIVIYSVSHPYGVYHAILMMVRAPVVAVIMCECPCAIYLIL